MNFKQGEIFAIDKPYRMSSFGALARVRYLLSRKVGEKVKIGHAGTLDPLATGVLVLCTGKATKQIEHLQTHVKEYVAGIQLGATTASYDLEHPVNECFPTAHITRESIEQALPQFIGDIEQVPPTYSAVKINGDRAYTLRRKGRDVELRPKHVHIEQIDIIGFSADTMQLTLRVVCGKGTYIRALARDLGRALGSGAHLISLRRTRVGEFTVDNSIGFDCVEEWLDNIDIERTQE